ncbi:MAG: ATP-binding protein [Verrucomicrobia bacterium]|nr:ATP-binding protein [Verrucomicrobiota bacterium]
MERELHQVIRQKITDALAAPVPAHTRRDVHLPGIKGKAMAVIGMRRSGKTTFLWQCLADRLKAGTPRDALLYFNFEDERLAEMTAHELQLVVEEYFSLHPERRDSKQVTFFLDEIQGVAEWETFVRRLLDTEKVELFLSGSSARLLSREVATSMRGRAMEVLVHPFSFREALRHRGAEPMSAWSDLPKAIRSTLDNHFRAYLSEGGFPESQGVPVRDRPSLLRTYVDVAILRDVIERHGVTNPAALRWLQRHLLGNPAGLFSVQKFFDALKSQGLPVGKNTLHDYLAHLEDAFLVRTVSLHTASERQRMVNPRKAYPIDPGLISLYERTGRANLGHALETVVLLELERRGCETDYVRTREGYEVDFFARDPEGNATLLQVCTDVSDTATHEREVRALSAAAAEYRGALPLLLTFDTLPPRSPLPRPLRWQPAIAWLLGDHLPRAGGKGRGTRTN